MTLKLCRQAIHRLVEFGVIIRRAGDDQRGTRFIDQDRVDLIHYSKGALSLYPLIRREGHVIAQVVKTKFVIGTVGDISGVGLLTLFMFQRRNHHANTHAEEVVELPHPSGITAGKVIIHRNHVNPFTRQRIEVDRQRCHQRLTLTGTHLGDLPLMQHHATNHLLIIVAHLEYTL